MSSIESWAPANESLVPLKTLFKDIVGTKLHLKILWKLSILVKDFLES
jgi:hypothetical protein